jgi:hypothetical protein
MRMKVFGGYFKAKQMNFFSSNLGDKKGNKMYNFRADKLL